MQARAVREYPSEILTTISAGLKTKYYKHIMMYHFVSFERGFESQSIMLICDFCEQILKAF